MKIFYLLVIFLFGFHAYEIKDEPQLAIEKKAVSGSEGVNLTAADFEKGKKLVLEPPDKNALFPCENCDANDPKGSATLKKQNSKRGVNLNRLWPNKTVHYLITPEFYANETALIARAVFEFHGKTCVRWLPRYRETDYVFFGKESSCESFIGKVGGRQTLSLKRSSVCFQFTTILHEMMHAIGFVHEHQRHDRNDFVFINSSNLITSENVDRDVTEIKSFAADVGPYDFNSVMHYTPYAFSANGLPTIVPLDRNNVIQRGASFSEEDVNEINHVYKCRSRQGPDGIIWEDDENNTGD